MFEGEAGSEGEVGRVAQREALWADAALAWTAIPPVELPDDPVIDDPAWLDRLAALDPDTPVSLEALETRHLLEGAPVDGQVAASLSEIPLSGCDRDQLLALVGLWSRMEAHAAAMKTRAVAAFATTNRPRIPNLLDATAHELAVMVRVPLPVAQQIAYHARRLVTHLPATLAAFTAGSISWWHVRGVLDVTGRLDQEQCAVVETKILRGAEHASAGELRRRARRWTDRIAPRDLTRRHHDAMADADVTVATDDDGIGWLSATMSATDALIVKAAADAYAARRKTAGDPRPLGQLRAEGLRIFAQHWLADAKPRQHGLPVEVQVAASPATVFGDSDAPGVIPATGAPVPADEVRRLARQAKLRWLLIDPHTGRLLYRDPKTFRYRPSAADAADALTSYPTAATPHSQMPSARADIDHVQSHAAGGPSHPSNYAPFDRPWHNGKTHAPFSVVKQPDGTITWTTPRGQAVTIHPYDYRLGP